MIANGDLLLRKIVVVLFLIVSIFYNAQVDSVQVELQKIKEKNKLLKIKDSIRMSLIEEELSKMSFPKSKDVNKYKQELLRIRREDSLRDDSLKKEINEARYSIKPHSVHLFEHKIFDVYTGLGPFTAKERAITAQSKIKQLYEKKVYLEDSLQLQTTQNYINLVYQGDIITSISHEDALWENISQDSLAHQYRQAINTSIAKSKDSHALQNVALRWLMVIGIALAFIILTDLIRKLIRQIIRKIVIINQRKPSGIKYKNYQFLTSRQLRVYLVQFLKWVHFIVFFLLLGVTLSLIFSLFPATEHWIYSILHWLWIPLKEVGESFIHYLPNLLRIVIILIVGRYLDRLLRFFSLEIERGILPIKGFHQEWANTTYHLLRICLIVFVIIMIFPYLPGADTTAFKGISVFFGVLISLGSSSAIVLIPLQDLLLPTCDLIKWGIGLKLMM